jgi:hypothetical protein
MLVALGLLLAPLGSVEVHSPSSVAGFIPDAIADFAPASTYSVDGQVVVATTCPCDWLWDDDAGRIDLDGKIMLLPESICAPSCSGRAAACAAWRYNISGVIASIEFANNVSMLSLDGLKEEMQISAQRLAYAERTTEVGCELLPGVHRQ